MPIDSRAIDLSLLPAAVRDRNPQSPIELTVVIVNWNTRDLLTQCLDSVWEDLSTRGPAASETWVVDNASGDGSADIVREHYPWVHLIENGTNVGFARANNQAIKQAHGRYLLLLNSDTTVHPGTLTQLLTFMDTHPEAGACGARLLNADGTLQPSCQPMLTPEREFWRLTFLEQARPQATYPMHTWGIKTPRRVEVIKGACLMLRRTALDQVGLLDDGYFMYTEEVDLCYRLAQTGWTLWYVPAAVVTHFGEGSSRQVAETMYVQLYRSKVQFYRKFGGPRRARRFKVLVGLAYAPRALIATVLGPMDAAWQPRARTYRRLLAELPGM
jgi:hypothetical protein